MNKLLKKDYNNLQKQIIDKTYKKKTLQSRREFLTDARRQTRDTLTLNNRKIDLNQMSPVTPIVSRIENNKKPIKKKEVGSSTKVQMLKQWKEKKLKLKQEEKKHSKPVFKVFHVDHGIGLPDLENVNKEIKGKLIKPKKIDITSSFAPARHKFIAPKRAQPILSNKPPSLDKPKANNTSSITRKNLPRTNSNISIKSLPDVANNAKKIFPKTSAGIKQVKPSNKKKCLSDAGPSTINDNNSTYAKIKMKKSNISELKTIDEGAKDYLVIYADSEVTMKTPIRNHTLRRSSRHTRDSYRPPSSGMSHAKTDTGLSRSSGNTPRDTPRPPRGRKSQAKTDTCLDLPISNTKTPTLTISKPETPKNKNPKTTTPKSKKKSEKIDVQLTEKFTDNVNKTPEVMPNSVTKTAVYISPFVTITRGKDSARKEYKIRKSTGGTFIKISDSRDFTDSTSPRAGAEYFEKIMENEITRIGSICEKWENYKIENEIAEETSDMINVALGQSRLLITKKFEQFRGLINQCKLCTFEEKPITCEDLHGFWDMIYQQVLDLGKRFDNLERLKENNWEEILPEKKVIKKKARGRPKKTAASSSLKEIIKAAKNKRKQQDLEQSAITDPNTPENMQISLSVKGNGSRRSLRTSLLKGPALRISSPGLTIMKITQAIKTGDGLTPSKSILKTDLTKSAKQKKSVLFVENVVPKKVIFSPEDKENNPNRANLNKSNEALVNSPMPLRRSKRLSKA